MPILQKKIVFPYNFAPGNSFIHHQISLLSRAEYHYSIKACSSSALHISTYAPRNTPRQNCTFRILCQNSILKIGCYQVLNEFIRQIFPTLDPIFQMAMSRLNCVFKSHEKPRLSQTVYVNLKTFCFFTVGFYRASACIN